MTDSQGASLPSGMAPAKTTFRASQQGRSLPAQPRTVRAQFGDGKNCVFLATLGMDMHGFRQAKSVTCNPAEANKVIVAGLECVAAWRFNMTGVRRIEVRC